MRRWRRSAAEPGPALGPEHGSAVVDFVLVAVVLVPLVLGVLQVALVAHVRATLAAAASEGARYGATVDRGPADAVVRTRARLDGVLAGRFLDGVRAGTVEVDGIVMVEVRARARVGALGPWGPAVTVDVVGHGVDESVP